MDLKELKRLADTQDDSGKHELINFLQSRTKGNSAPLRAIDEIQEQKHKDGLVCPHCKNYSVVRFGKYVVKTRTGEVKRHGVATKYLQHYLAWFRYLVSKEYENTTSNKKNMLVLSCLFAVNETNTNLDEHPSCAKLTEHVLIKRFFNKRLNRRYIFNGDFIM